LTENFYRAIDPAEIDAFNTDGVVVLRELVTPAWLETIAQSIELDILNPGPFYHGYEAPEGGRFHGNMRLVEHDEALNAFCKVSPLPGVAQQFMGSNKVNLLYDQLFVKEPGTTNRTRWHNDQPYWSIRGWQVLSLWVALDTTTAENGALEFIRGSHHWDRWFQPETFGNSDALAGYEHNPNYEPIPDIDSSRDDYDIVSWDLEPGDVYLFHALTVHGAAGNSTSNRRRRGYTVRYTGDDAVYDTRPGTNVHLRNAELNDGDSLDSEQYPLVIAPSSMEPNQ
jgi:ectoine hydroxylase-related dioxygenase (phytanoyl-CoA dioxygenase family)